MAEEFDLQAFRARRDAAMQNGEAWPCTLGELLAAYTAGERNFRRANLRGANLCGANLSEANLSGAYLSGAYLSEANLSGAYLSWANLCGANLCGANLSWANLSEANLSGAYLSWANLSWANLRGANLRGTTLPKGFYVLQIGPVGSRRAYICAVSDNGRQDIRTGCFCGTLDEFIAAVEEKDAGDPYRVEYEVLVIPALHTFFALHAPTTKKEADNERNA